MLLFATYLLLFVTPLRVNAYEYKWKITLMEQTQNMTVKESTLMRAALPLIRYSLFFNKTSIIPLVGFSEKLNTDVIHEVSPYFVETRVVNSNGQIVNDVMRTLLLSGYHPLLHVEYVTDQYLLDSGNALLKIAGAIKDENSTGESFELPDIVWIFPLPMQDQSQFLQISLPEIVTGQITISKFRKSYFPTMYDFLSDGRIRALPTAQPFRVSVHASDSFIGYDDQLIVSHNEFETSVVKQLPVNPLSTSCSDGFETVVDMPDKLIQFTKSGIFVLSLNTSGIFKPKAVTYNLEELCADYVSVPQMARHSTILITAKNKLLILRDQNISEDSTFAMELAEVEDEQNATACQFLSLQPSDCFILFHTFASQCCSMYVLVESRLSSRYYLLEYSDARVWVLLKHFPSRAPSRLTLLGENYALVEEDWFVVNAQTTWIQLTLLGMREMHVSNGHIYLWGNVFLMFDKRSSLLIALLTSGMPNANITFNGNMVEQFAYKKGKEDFSLLLSNGDLWHGISKSSFDIVRIVKNDKKVIDFMDRSLSNILGLYYDSFHSLYVLAITEPSVSRYFIDVNLKQSEYPAVWMSVTCENTFAYAWLRRYALYPPRIWPGRDKLRNSDILDYRTFSDFDYLSTPLYSDEQLVMYRSGASMLVNKEKIGTAVWWSGDNKKSSSWYFKNDGLEEYLEYVSINNLHLESNWTSYLSHHDYKIERNSMSFSCDLPSIVYLDKDVIFRFNVSLSPGRGNPLLSITQLTVFVSISANDIISYEVIKHIRPLQTSFEVKFKGLRLDQHAPGVMLKSVSANIWPWRPKEENYTVPGSVDILFKVGCPPALSLQFDKARSAEILAERGRIENFDCIYDLSDDIPCFTTSEFVTVFFVEDHVTGIKTPYKGNFTLKVVGGGVGYVENMVNYTDEEIAMYNYRPGASKALQSLIWTVLSETDTVGMKDNATGELIFNSKNPASIVFQCRLDSPCGNIPVVSPNPSEFFLMIETSNNGVDSSTNCDFTMRFVIHLIGIELNPKSHLTIMLVTLSILIVCIFLYYELTDGDGRGMLLKLLHRKVEDRKQTRDTSSQLQQVLRSKRGSVSGVPFRVPSHLQLSSKRAGLLSQSLHLDPSLQKKSLSWYSADTNPRHSFDSGSAGIRVSAMNLSESLEQMVTNRKVIRAESASPSVRTTAVDAEAAMKRSEEQEKNLKANK